MGKNHTAEFKQEAVRVALTSGLTRKQVAADFGVGFSTLSHWIQQDRKNPEKPTMQMDLEREITELRKEKAGQVQCDPMTTLLQTDLFLSKSGVPNLTIELAAPTISARFRLLASIRG